jgi:hypothetical protein
LKLKQPLLLLPLLLPLPTLVRFLLRQQLPLSQKRWLRRIALNALKLKQPLLLLPLLLPLPTLVRFLLRQQLPLSQKRWLRRIVLNGLKLKQPLRPLLLLLLPLPEELGAIPAIPAPTRRTAYCPRSTRCVRAYRRWPASCPCWLAAAAGAAGV